MDNKLSNIRHIVGINGQISILVLKFPLIHVIFTDNPAGNDEYRIFVLDVEYPQITNIIQQLHEAIIGIFIFCLWLSIFIKRRL